MTTLADTLKKSIQSIVTRDTGLKFGPPRWMVLARIEDDRSDFPADQRITHRTLDELVDTFDPEWRRVPIICAQGRDIPAHWADPLPPVGEIVALDRDLINLWGHVRSVIDPILGIPRLDLCVAHGFNDRSIGFHTGTNETEGRAALFHLALLGGEPPGIPNMPSLVAHGFGLDDEQLETLRQRCAALPCSADPSDRTTVAQLLGHAVGDLTREWAALGGLERYRELAAELQHRTTCHFAFDEDDEDLIQEAQTMDPEKLEALAEGLTRGLELLGTVAERLAPPPTDDPPEAEATPPETPPVDPDHLRRRARHIAHRAVALGILPKQAAEAHAVRLLEAGEAALDAWDDSVDEMARAQQGQVFKEVRVVGGPPVQVNLMSTQFRVLSIPQLEVNEKKLAILSRVTEELRRQNPNAKRIDPRQLERAAQRMLNTAAHAGETL